MKKISISVIILMTLLFSGCSQLGAFDETKIEKPINNYPVTIYNETFSKPAEKVVSISPAITEIFFEIGFGDKLIGRSEYCTYPEQAKNIASVGSPAKVDFNKIIELKPDLVITQSPIATIDLKTLQDNKIKVLSIPSPKSFYEVMDIYAAIAKIFKGNNDSNEAVEKSILEFDKKIDEVADKTYGKSFLYITSQNGAVATDDTLESQVLSIFGDNLASEYKEYTVPTEEISKMKPEIIFIAKSVDKENLPEQFEKILSNEENIIEIDNSIFEKPTTRIAEQIISIDQVLSQKK